MAKKKKKSKKSKRKFSTNFKKAVRRDSERQKQAASSYGYLNLPSGVSMFNPEPKSKVWMDIMPYIVSDENHPDKYEEEGIAIKGELWYKRPFSVHRGVGIENDSVVCLRSIGKQCPICEYRERRMKEGASYDEDDVQQAKPSKRNLYVVIPRKSKDYDQVPHIWDMSQFLFQNLLNEELEEDEDYAIFPSLEEGKTLRVRFDEGKAFNTSFAEASRIDFRDRKKPYDESILDDVPNLDEVLEILSYEELEAKFLELDPDDIADEDEVIDEDLEDFDEDEDLEEFEEEEEDDFDKDLEEFDEDEDLEEFEDEEFEEDLEDFDEDEFDEDEFDEDLEEFDEEEFDDFEEDEEEDEEEPEPNPKKNKKKKKKKSKKSKRKKKK